MRGGVRVRGRLRRTRSGSGSTGDPPSWLARAVRGSTGRILVWLILALVFAPFVIAGLVLVDLLVSHHTGGDGSGHFRSSLLHTVAWPFEIVIFLALVAAAVGFLGYATVRGGRALAAGLLVTIHGRATTGTITGHLRTDNPGGSADDPPPDDHWRVQFSDHRGVLRSTGYSTPGSTGRPVQVGTGLRVRYQVNRPGNTWVRRPGWSSWVGGVLRYLVLFVVWLGIASLPAGLLVGLVWWTYRLLSSL